MPTACASISSTTVAARFPDDARWLASVCGVSLRKWASLRQRLIDLGKLIAEGGFLTNRRA